MAKRKTFSPEEHVEIQTEADADRMQPWVRAVYVGREPGAGWHCAFRVGNRYFVPARRIRKAEPEGRRP